MGQSTEKILNLDSRFNKLNRAVHVIVNHFTVLIKDVDKLNVHMNINETECKTDDNMEKC